MRADSPQDPLRQQLNATSRGLLRIHKALIDHERTRYERQRGPVRDAGTFLQLLLGDPWFAWLRPVSQLVALIDEYLESKEPVDPREGEALLAQARSLLVPDEGGGAFQREYHRSLQESPEVAMRHGEWKLSAPPDAGPGGRGA